MTGQPQNPQINFLPLQDDNLKKNDSFGQLIEDLE
jgi:hypothetical protein